VIVATGAQQIVAATITTTSLTRFLINEPPVKLVQNNQNCSW